MFYGHHVRFAQHSPGRFTKKLHHVGSGGVQRGRIDRHAVPAPRGSTLSHRRTPKPELLGGICQKLGNVAIAVSQPRYGR
jgi:hypothetical protein